MIAQIFQNQRFGSSDLVQIGCSLWMHLSPTAFAKFRFFLISSGHQASLSIFRGMLDVPKKAGCSLDFCGAGFEILWFLTLPFVIHEGNPVFVSGIAGGNLFSETRISFAALTNPSFYVGIGVKRGLFREFVTVDHLGLLCCEGDLRFSL